jgi:hypothetical protein
MSSGTELAALSSWLGRSIYMANGLMDAVEFIEAAMHEMSHNFDRYVCACVCVSECMRTVCQSFSRSVPHCSFSICIYLAFQLDCVDEDLCW